MKKILIVIASILGITLSACGTTHASSYYRPYSYPNSKTSKTSSSSKSSSSFSQENNDWSIFEVEDGWAIEKYNGSEQRLTIPSTINGHKIVEIAASAFRYNEKLLSVSLPNSILRIGNHAFSGCTRLSQFNIPDNCVSVGEKCLAATKIQEVTIPNSLTNFGSAWLLYAPVKRIVFKGDIPNDKFVGDILNLSLSATAGFQDYNDGPNVVSEHFKQVHKESNYKTVYFYVGNELCSNEFPLKVENDWELLETNRFFSIPTSFTINGNTYTYNNRFFANGKESDYYISKSSNMTPISQDYGTVYYYDYVIRYIQGNFYTGLDSLEEIKIPSSSSSDTSKLLGRLDNITITNN